MRPGFRGADIRALTRHAASELGWTESPQVGAARPRVIPRLQRISQNAVKQTAQNNAETNPAIKSPRKAVG